MLPCNCVPETVLIYCCLLMSCSSTGCCESATLGSLLASEWVVYLYQLAVTVTLAIDCYLGQVYVHSTHLSLY